MKTLQNAAMAVLISLLMTTAVLANGPPGGSINIDFETEDFVPRVFLDPTSVIMYDLPENGGAPLEQRISNYCYNGEKIVKTALVVDKNGIGKVNDVYMAIDNVYNGNNFTLSEIQVNCYGTSDTDVTPFNAIIEGDLITIFDEDIMAIYTCEFICGSWTGPYWLNIIAEDADEQLGWADEAEYFYMNPTVRLVMTGGPLNFGVVTPGHVAYSDPIVITNDADPGSGVMINMFISGTSYFLDPDSSGAMCPTSSGLSLSRFAYYAENGFYHTSPTVTTRVSDVGDGNGDGIITPGEGVEGYYWIPYETGSLDSFDDVPDDIYGAQEIIEGAGTITLGIMDFEAGNLLTPGADITLIFRLALPSPCNGDFTQGSIYFWGQPI